MVGNGVPYRWHGGHSLDLMNLARNEKEGLTVGLDLVLRIAGVGILASVLCTILKQQDKEEYSLLVATAGLVVVFVMLLDYIEELLSSVRTVFRLW